MWKDIYWNNGANLLISRYFYADSNNPVHFVESNFPWRGRNLQKWFSKDETLSKPWRDFLVEGHYFYYDAFKFKFWSWSKAESIWFICLEESMFCKTNKSLNTKPKFLNFFLQRIVSHCSRKLSKKWEGFNPITFDPILSYYPITLICFVLNPGSVHIINFFECIIGKRR